MNPPAHPVRARLTVIASAIAVTALIAVPAGWYLAHRHRAAATGSAGSAHPVAGAAAGDARGVGAGAVTGPPADGGVGAGGVAAGDLAGGGGSGGSPSPAGIAAPVCGTRVPLPLTLPLGYSGPLPGPAYGAPEPDLPGQLVVHWVGTDGQLEARWPADAWAGPADSSGVLVAHRGGPGEPEMIGTALVPDRSGACRRLRLAFYWSPPRGFAEQILGPTGRDPGFDALYALVAPARERSLVYDGEHVDQVPAHARTCGAGSVPNHGGRITGATARADAREALRDFLRPEDGSRPPLTVVSGYRELIDGSGRISYAVPSDAGPGYLAVVRMAHRAGGWVAQSWEASGC